MSCRFEIDQAKLQQALQCCAVPSLIYVVQGLSGVLETLQSPNDVAIVNAAKKVLEAVEEAQKSQGAVEFTASGYRFRQVYVALAAHGEVVQVYDRWDDALIHFERSDIAVSLAKAWRPVDTHDPFEIYFTKEEAKLSRGVV